MYHFYFFLMNIFVKPYIYHELSGWWQVYEFFVFRYTYKLWQNALPIVIRDAGATHLKNEQK